jgi:predicted GNAT superfamily acetyltransferase
MTDEINAGDRSDRLVVRWDLDPDPAPRPWVDGLPAVLRSNGDPEDPLPMVDVGPADDGGVVEIPRDHADLRNRDPSLAARWRDATADVLEACFQAGLIVGAFDRTRSAYVLIPRGA